MSRYLFSFDPAPIHDNRADKASDIWAIEKDLFIVNGYINHTDGRTMEFFKIDANNADIVLRKVLEGPQNDIAIPSQGGYCLTSDGCAVVTGEWYDYENSRMRTFLAKIDQNLEPEWINYCNDLSSNHVYGYAVAETDSNRYLMSFVEQESENPYRVVLRIVEFDSLGQQGFNKIIPDTFSITSSFGDLTPTDDGNFILNGFVHDFTHHPSTPYNTIVHKINARGEVLWSRIMDYVAFLRQDGLSTTLADGGSAVCWRKDTTWFDWITVNDEFPVLYGLDQDGNALWRHEWYDVSIRAVNRIITARNGDILGVGVYSKNDSKARTWLFRVSSEGEVLWERHYSDSIQRPWSPQLEMLDLCEMDDGRIAATGIVFDTNALGDINLNIGLLVVDSLGCIEPECEGLLHYVTSVGPNFGSRDLPLMTCTPNPARRLFNVSLPEGYTDSKSRRELRCYDMQGMLVYALPWDRGQGQIEIDCARWGSGMYRLLLFEEGMPTAACKVSVSQ